MTNKDLTWDDLLDKAQEEDLTAVECRRLASYMNLSHDPSRVIKSWGRLVKRATDPRVGNLYESHEYLRHAMVAAVRTEEIWDANGKLNDPTYCDTFEGA